MATIKYAEEKTMRIYINNLVEAVVVTNMTQAEEEYITHLFYKCVNTSNPDVKFGLKFNNIFAKNIQICEGCEHSCIYEDGVRHIYSFPEAVQLLMETELDYLCTKHEYVDLCKILRSEGISCFHGNDAWKGRFYITAKNPAEVSEMYRALCTHIRIEDPSQVHIGNNCIWIPEDMLFVERKHMYYERILDPEKVKAFKGSVLAEIGMHSYAGLL